jgi:hypothetical protein
VDGGSRRAYRAELMAAKKGPTAEDRVEAARLTLDGLASGRAIDDIVADLYAMHPRYNTFPAEELLDLAADAIEESGASRESPIDYEGIRGRFFPEYTFRGRSDHQRSHYVLGAAAMIRAGIQPDLLGEIRWWSSDDLWLYAFYALLIYVRAAADNTDRSVEVVARVLAAKRNLAPVGTDA